ncbi:MAG: tRNA lysidine(34) synthetase TilS [Candidatus Choladocola sp.]|nr:tRNA lysidine(34) synthetase TilS [Candidatus Choladocola sp.]
MEKIFRTIEQYGMIAPGMRVAAGVSGGADSVCLLYILSEYRKKIPFELAAVHVEHGIRGAESLEDAAFTESLCRELHVPCHTVRTDVQKIAEDRGLSVEEAGRLERYRIFAEFLKEWNGNRIAVAHNENDQAETVLWNLVRGSGLRGLGGIRPVRGEVIRPLLFTARDEIEQILAKAGIPWRTDRTNLETEYTRNRIRLSLLPQMERELNAQSCRHIAEAAAKLQEVETFVQRRTEEAAKRCLSAAQDPGGSPGTVRIDLDEYFREDELIQKEILRKGMMLLEGSRGLKDIGTVHLDQLGRLARMDCGKECCLPGRVRAVREKGILRLEKLQEKDRAEEKADDTETDITAGGSFKNGSWRIKSEILWNNPEIREEIKTEKKYTKWLSYDTINNSMRFRTRRPGDYLVINEQGGRKKLKDYFIDLKIPAEQRGRIRLLADGSHILWVVGYRISEAAKVRQETKRVIKIQVEEDNDEGKSQDFFA